MAEFCTCGSIMIEGSCTNKSCANKLTSKKPAAKSAKARAGTVNKKTTVPAKTRKSSKCITYSLDELEEKEKNA